MQIKDKIWWTRKSRIQTEKRLLANDFQAQLILLWYAFFSVAVSIYYLTQKSNSDIAPGVWVILSVFSLIASSYISALNFKSRAALVKECYERLDILYSLACSQGSKNEEIQAQYNDILGLCENHIDLDYRTARCELHFSGSKDFTPKFSNYDLFIWAYKRSSRLLLLIIIYTSPAALFFYLEVGHVCYR